MIITIDNKKYKIKKIGTVNDEEGIIYVDSKKSEYFLPFSSIIGVNYVCIDDSLKGWYYKLKLILFLVLSLGIFYYYHNMVVLLFFITAMVVIGYIEYKNLYRVKMFLNIDGESYLLILNFKRIGDVCKFGKILKNRKIDGWRSYMKYKGISFKKMFLNF